MKHKHSISVFCLLTVLAVASCSPRPHDARQSSQLPPIFPDYVDVTVPVDVAPLHFSLPDSVADYICAEARGKGAVAMEAAGKELCTSQELLPVYLRLSQAERERQARLSRNTNR